MKKGLIGIAVLSLLFTVSCTEEANDVTKKADKTIKKPTVNVEEELLLESMEEDFILPSPIRIAGIFESAGLEFTQGLTNPIENAESYSDKFTQMLNFGVYTADLAYCALNSQSQEAQNYMGAVQKLARPTGMAPVFENEDLLKKFNSNITNQDSIRDLLIDVHERTSEFMDDNDMKGVAAIHFAGAWIEGMYLGSSDVRNKDNSEIATQLVEQMTILNNIIKGLGQYPGKSEKLDNLVSELQGIKNLFDGFPSIKKYDAGEGDLTLTKDEINKLIEAILKVRNRITKTA